MSFGQTLDHAWWLASRSAGIVAYVLLSASVVLGLAMALKLAPPRFTALLRAAHERIALLALGALAAHGLLLLGDGFLRPGIAGILVPFTMSYRPTWTGIGILAGYLTAGLSLTYYARQRIGARRWRTAHRLIPVAWAMAVVHVIGSGSDAGSLWLQVPLALTMSAVLTLLGYRVLAGRAARDVPSRRRAPAPAAAAAPATAAAGASAAPTQPMAVVPRPVIAAPADEAVTTVAPAGGYRPLWARNPSPPS
jgi:sulfoxide reductase heme-binding subunit YedZ